MNANEKTIEQKPAVEAVTLHGMVLLARRVGEEWVVTQHGYIGAGNSPQEAARVCVLRLMNEECR